MTRIGGSVEQIPFDPATLIVQWICSRDGCIKIEANENPYSGPHNNKVNEYIWNYSH